MANLNNHIKAQQGEIAVAVPELPPDKLEGLHPILIQGGVAVAVILAIAFLIKAQWEGIANLINTLKK